MTVNTIAPQKLNLLTARSFFHSPFPQSRTGRKDNPTSTLRRAVGRVCGPLKKFRVMLFSILLFLFLAHTMFPTPSNQRNRFCDDFLKRFNRTDASTFGFDLPYVRTHGRESISSSTNDSSFSLLCCAFVMLSSHEAHERGVLEA